MASTIEICNLALTKGGSKRITSLDDDAKAAQSLNAIYEVTRKSELAAHPWVFAMKRARLPASTTAPAFGWSTAFPLPTDCLRLVEVGDEFVLYPPDVTLFEIEGNSILCDETSPLDIKYVQDITNAGLFTPMFVQVLACRLWADVCEDLTQNASKCELAEKKYEIAVRNARRANAIQIPPRQQPEDSWVTAMRGGRG